MTHPLFVCQFCSQELHNRVSSQTVGSQSVGGQSVNLSNFLNNECVSGSLLGGLVTITTCYEHGSHCEHKCDLFHFFAFLKSVKQSFVY